MFWRHCTSLSISFLFAFCWNFILWKSKSQQLWEKTKKKWKVKTFFIVPNRSRIFYRLKHSLLTLSLFSLSPSLSLFSRHTNNLTHTYTHTFTYTHSHTLTHTHKHTHIRNYDCKISPIGNRSSFELLYDSSIFRKPMVKQNKNVFKE